MKTTTNPLATLFVLLAMSASAAVRYVDVNNANPAPPCATWATAATNIQDAIDLAADGDEIVVTNGVYRTGGRVADGAMTNRVAVNKPLTLRSVNGPGVTVIEGYKDPGDPFSLNAVRCVYLSNGASLLGFTLTNGATQPYERGGGVRCASATDIVSNSVLTGNSAYSGGGAYGGTLKFCTVSSNEAWRGGGAFDSALNNCTLSGNAAPVGGGTYGGTLNNCMVSSNSASRGGGAASCGDCLPLAMLNNCILIGNTAGEGGGAWASQLNNCTLVGNEALNSGGGAAYGCLFNCIAYDNTAPIGANYFFEPRFGYCLAYSCTIPLPPVGEGNFTNAPVFVHQAGGNLRLQTNSPCINSGLNFYAPSVFDLDGFPRVAGGTVDVGAYEFQSPQSVISYAWLQQYSLPTDGSADFTDSDGDGMTNRQEWRAGTEPTNALSVLRLLTPVPVGSDFVLRWESVPGRYYFLERSTNLTQLPPFLPLASGIIGQYQSGTTTYTETNGAGRGPYFYRVGVE
ncbi:MAG TPA: choice-of-anchor Q domain-containing protein [Verrucomicrobiae bacterium]|nr:choice-of-anchor Q domain-containing protein [Verrucomicrobiae bacterium]